MVKTRPDLLTEQLPPRIGHPDALLSYSLARLRSSALIVPFDMRPLPDFVSGRPPIARPVTSLAWVYLHLPVAMGIAAVGASLLNVVEHAGEPLPSEVLWLLVGAIATALVSVALILRILDLSEAYRRLYRNGSILMLSAGALVVGLGLTPIDPLPLLLVLSALLLAPVVYGILIWIKVFDAREMEL
jgi:Bacterial low temperature requirement A protein (LtrA)